MSTPFPTDRVMAVAGKMTTAIARHEKSSSEAVPAALREMKEPLLAAFSSSTAYVKSKTGKSYARLNRRYPDEVLALARQCRNNAEQFTADPRTRKLFLELAGIFDTITEVLDVEERPDPYGESIESFIDTDTKLNGGVNGPFEYWEHDHTALVHVLWAVKHRGMSLHDNDDAIARTILRSRWFAAAKAAAVEGSPRVTAMNKLLDELVKHADGDTSEFLTPESRALFEELAAVK